MDLQDFSLINTTIRSEIT